MLLISTQILLEKYNWNNTDVYNFTFCANIIT